MIAIDFSSLVAPIEGGQRGKLQCQWFHFAQLERCCFLYQVAQRGVACPAGRVIEISDYFFEQEGLLADLHEWRLAGPQVLRVDVRQSFVEKGEELPKQQS